MNSVRTLLIVFFLVGMLFGSAVCVLFLDNKIATHKSSVDMPVLSVLKYIKEDMKDGSEGKVEVAYLRLVALIDCLELYFYHEGPTPEFKHREIMELEASEKQDTLDLDPSASNASEERE